MMPLLYPVVRLGPCWLAADAAGILLFLIPARWLARWTRNSAHLGRRVALQAAGFSGLALVILPATVAEQLGLPYAKLLQTFWWTDLLAVPAVLGIAAAQEFAERGQGTPVPLDPPAGLLVAPAESHPEKLTRITYESGDGFAASGVLALMHALAHIHLGWAIAAWTARLPLIRICLQVLTDACGATENGLSYSSYNSHTRLN
jgi:hypothetical protein